MTRLSRALHSSDLRHRTSDCDADTLQAAGSAAIRSPLGVLLAEVLEASCGDSGASVARLRELNQMTARRVADWAKRWGIGVNSERVGELLVREVVLDRCPRCSGRGFLPLSYGLDVTETSADEVDCPDCLGSGQGRRDRRARAIAAGHPEYTRHLDEFWDDCLKRLAITLASAKHQMTNKLHGDSCTE